MKISFLWNKPSVLFFLLKPLNNFKILNELFLLYLGFVVFVLLRLLNFIRLFLISFLYNILSNAYFTYTNVHPTGL